MTAVIGDVLPARYDDFSVIIHTTRKTGGIARIVSILQDIQERSPEELGAFLPGIPADHWKFGAAMPGFAIRAMTLADFYQIDRFHQEIAGTAIHILGGAEEPDTGGMNGEGL
jgi:hypothetical protein